MDLHTIRYEGSRNRNGFHLCVGQFVNVFVSMLVCAQNISITNHCKEAGSVLNIISNAVTNPIECSVRKTYSSRTGSHKKIGCIIVYNRYFY